MSSAKPTKRFTLPKVLAVTLMACTGPHPTPDGGPEPVVDAGTYPDGGVDCSTALAAESFNCECCNAVCEPECGTVVGFGPNQCACLI